jgi:hypothetical protein
MSHRALAGLIIVLVASSGQSPVQPSALAEAAQPGAVAVEVSLVPDGVVVHLPGGETLPATPSGDGDWCIDNAVSVTLTAHVVAVASQSEVTEGWLGWQFCADRMHQGLPKEDCDGHGPGRWLRPVRNDLSVDSTPSLTTFPQVPVRGIRLEYLPNPGSGFESATSQSFNLDRTCPL